MKLPNSKQTTLASILTFGLLGLLAGILLIALDTAFLIKIVFVVMGVVTVLYNVPALLIGFMTLKTRAGVISFVLSLISTVIGVLMIFWHESVLMLVLGAYMLIFPLVQILCAKDKLTQLKTQLPKLIVGVVLLLIGPAKALNVVFDLAGWIVLILTAIYIVTVLVGQSRVSKHVDQTGNRIFVDTTGDGKVDTVYVDTTGDGKVDTSTKYRDESK